MKKPLNSLLFCALFCTVFAFTGCDKKKFFAGPEYYQDGFESYSAFDDLFIGDDSLWSLTQQTMAGNSITVDTATVHSGSQSLKFVAVKSPENGVSKCSISKQNMAFWDGETVRVTAWYYLEGTQSVDWLFLFDMEEQVPIGAGPGMRIALVDDQLRVEHKFYEPDILQDTTNAIDFPRNQWVEVVWEMTLSQKDEGSVKLWQDGALIINSENERTLPRDILYDLQGTKAMYSSIEIGITANSKDNDLTIWADDILFERLP